MANTDITQREGYERATLSGDAERIRHGTERGAAIYSVIALVVGAALSWAVVSAIDSWAQWLVLAVIVVFSVAVAFAVGPNRVGAGQASRPDAL